ncbi:ATP-binding protein [Nonomuraea terrae]|uniref:ATP-binding protein n=1 Tax=Nonomuraea terrae TaxID=2530383 RepID=UPI0014048411|nr:ATP-binding protein [Nonomuraea terrae]
MFSTSDQAGETAMSMEFELRCPVSADLGFIRDLVRLHARHSGLRGERLDDLVLAVNEAVTNVLDHGGKAGTVTAVRTGRGVRVEVMDVAGRLTGDHLGSATIDPAGSHGFGLWVIRHLCDEVVVEQTAAGSRLTLHVHRGMSPRYRPFGRHGSNETQHAGN